MMTADGDNINVNDQGWGRSAGLGRAADRSGEGARRERRGIRGQLAALQVPVMGTFCSC
jgi:hypothetical protein